MDKKIIWELQEYEERLDNLETNMSDIEKRVSKLEEKDKIQDELINRLIEHNQNLMKTRKNLHK